MTCHRSIKSNILYSTDHDADIVSLYEESLYPADSTDFKNKPRRAALKRVYAHNGKEDQ